MLGQSRSVKSAGSRPELDLGDLVGIEGKFGKTKRGEPTIFAEKLTFLSKSL